MPLINTGGTSTIGTLYKGVWSSADTYAINDIVIHELSSYISILGSVNENPSTATTYWASFGDGSIGSQGSQGSQGRQGLAGTNGSQGSQGSQGLQGLQGNQGSIGLQGLQGNQGVVGSQGDQGSRGSQGSVGFQGLKGDQGDQGSQGRQGTQGTQGFQGSQGNQGSQGSQGRQGFTGSSGTQGSKGDQGDIGSKGGTSFAVSISSLKFAFDGIASNDTAIQLVRGQRFIFDLSAVTHYAAIRNGGGVTTNVIGTSANNIETTGSVGEIITYDVPLDAPSSGIVLQSITNTSIARAINCVDYIGAQGSQGVQGSQGSQGSVGTQGFQGNQGLGNQGLQGLQGSVGQQGLQGFQGRQGLAGNDGNQGDQGSRGYQGFQGYQGFVGSTGPIGSQGDQGSAGTNGTSGSAGAQGYQGFQGVVGAGIAWRGDWSSANNYSVSDVVYYLGTSYIAILASTSTASKIPDANPTYWSTLAQAGAIGGAGGPTGPQGRQGLTGLSGSQGAQGRQGVTGSQGLRGSQGYQGDYGQRGGTLYTVTNNASAIEISGIANAAAIPIIRGQRYYFDFTASPELLAIRTTSGSNAVVATTLNNDTLLGTKNVVTWDIPINESSSTLLIQSTQSAKTRTFTIVDLRGSDGAAGVNGTNGTDGAAGPKGDIGDTGPTGPEGPAGITGPTGPQGYQGLIGSGIVNFYQQSTRPAVNPSDNSFAVWYDTENAVIYFWVTDINGSNWISFSGNAYA